ncbi:helix-turn-helix transcriptional regulator [Sphingomonas sp.]|uniref:helix-turn-helix domain-containing protein n=1 Tax=Sphingomonas sp. TaxID=28214 RepID=UPI0025F5A39C|nr:helix-turn-helix transcriptional regulator [Sphingomonas sp.]
MSDPAAERIRRLSEGQLDCLRLVAQHLSSKEIAAQLGISSHTVDQRVRGALQVLGVERRSQAARLVAQETGPYQRLIHQAPYIAAVSDDDQQEGAISHQIRHADRAGGAGETGSETEQGSQPRSPLVLPFATRSNPRNEMSVGRRLTWIIIIAVGSTFSAGMYLAGLESLSRMLGH